MSCIKILQQMFKPYFFLYSQWALLEIACILQVSNLYPFLEES